MHEFFVHSYLLGDALHERVHVDGVELELLAI